MTTLYLGCRDAEGRGIVLVHAPDQSPRLGRPLLIDSLDALAWGDHGAGARNLALALLADHLGEAKAIPPHDRFDPRIGRLIEETGAWLLHEEFWQEVSAPLPKERGFVLDTQTIGAGLAPRRAELGRLPRERTLLALIGERVRLTDGSVVTVLDVIDGGPGVLLYAVGHSALRRVVARAAVTILPLTGAAEDAQDGEDAEGAA